MFDRERPQTTQLFPAVVLLFLAWFSGITCQQAIPDEPIKSEASNSDVGSRRKRMEELANSYIFRVPNAPDSVKLVHKPLFSWATPERQAIGGEIYLWTMRGRPFASIGIWTYDDILDSHELQSLAEVPFEASTSATTPNVSTMAKSNPWQPRSAGLIYRQLNGASLPESTPVRRLSQAKTIMRERFTASIRQNAGSSQELRLIIQPLYRYEPFPPGVIDGLMFAFAMGTDPEVLILLEARSAGDSAAWYYAVAPCTSVLAKCSIDHSEVWTSENQVVNGTFRMYMNR